MHQSMCIFFCTLVATSFWHVAAQLITPLPSRSLDLAHKDWAFYVVMSLSFHLFSPTLVVLDGISNPAGPRATQVSEQER